jgi:hypothetical protein
MLYHDKGLTGIMTMMVVKRTDAIKRRLLVVVLELLRQIFGSGLVENAVTS